MQILQIQNKSAKVKLTEQVDKWSTDDLIREIDQVYGAKASATGANFGEIMNCADNAADTLDIEIHSPGGSVLDGYRVYRALMDLRERGVEVTARISLAASMASVIAMAANRIVMLRGARMMIHEASVSTHGDAATHQKNADLLESISAEIAGIYAHRTGLDSEEARALMKKETWMDGKQAVEMKFADEFFDTPAKEKSPADNSMSILDRLTNPSNAEALSQIEALQGELTAANTEAETLKAQLSTAENALQDAAVELANLRDAAEKLVDAERITNEQAQTIADLQEQVKATEEKVSIRAAELLSATGHKAPVQSAGENGEIVNNETKYEQYRKLQKSDPVAASAFWNANEQDIIAGK